MRQLAVLLLLCVASALAAQEPPPGLADAYLDSNAADILRRVRARKDGEDQSLLGYRVIATQRVGVGLRALRRDRILYHHEVTARVEWRRGDTARVEALGARQGIPVARGAADLPEELEGLFSDLAFDPDRDLLRFGATSKDSSDGPLNPLARGSESSYRFRSGDTTTMRFPDGRTLRIVELVVVPRRAEFRLIAGSFWFDAATYGAVRAIFRMARPFDLERDGEDEDDRDVPSVLKPIRADIRYVSIEYGLQAYRWWLPRVVALEAEAQIGSLMRVPVRFERLYTEYQVDGGDGLPAARAMPLPQRSADELARAAQAQQRGRVRGRVQVQVGEETDSAATGQRRRVRGRVQVQVGEGTDSTRADSASAEHHKHGGMPVIVTMPADTSALATSPYLPPSFYEPGAELVSEAELREIGRAAGLLPALGMPALGTFRWAPRDPTLLRYNRVEGLSFGARADVERDRLLLEATARIGWADLTPNAELGAAYTNSARRLRLGLYSRLTTVDQATRPFGVGNSVNAMLFGRDDGDYFRAHGVEVALNPAPGRRPWYSVRLYAEAQRAATKETDVSLRRLWESGHRFRAMVPALRANQAGLGLTLHGQRGADPERLALSADVYGEAATGDARFARGSLTARMAFPVPLGLATAVEASAGTSAGTVPAQSLWYLGGPASLRGYAGAAAVGDAFWRARVDLASRATAARLTLFGDAAWAGSRADFAEYAPFAAKPLLSWGVGASFLDGLVRLDVARGLRRPAGWRVDLYWDGAL